MTKKKVATYIVEYYRDDYKTLFQAIMINLRQDKLSKGKHSQYERSRVNPNLHLYREIYLNNKHEIIADNWIEH